jgi:hypothetical protein
MRIRIADGNRNFFNLLFFYILYLTSPTGFAYNSRILQMNLQSAHVGKYSIIVLNDL